MYVILTVWSTEEIDMLFNGEINLFSVPPSILLSSFRNSRDALCTPDITGKIIIIPNLDESQVYYVYFYIPYILFCLYNVTNRYVISYLCHNIKMLLLTMQVVDTLAPLCLSANLNDTVRLVNELHHFLDWDQIEAEVSLNVFSLFQ